MKVGEVVEEADKAEKVDDAGDVVFYVSRTLFSYLWSIGLGKNSVEIAMVISCHLVPS
jgi:hypothetical protein